MCICSCLGILVGLCVTVLGQEPIGNPLPDDIPWIKSGQPPPPPSRNPQAVIVLGLFCLVFCPGGYCPEVVCLCWVLSLHHIFLNSCHILYGFIFPLLLLNSFKTLSGFYFTIPNNQLWPEHVSDIPMTSKIVFTSGSVIITSLRIYRLKFIIDY